jgi:hypothetical protein
MVDEMHHRMNSGVAWPKTKLGSTEDVVGLKERAQTVTNHFFENWFTTCKDKVFRK